MTALNFTLRQIADALGGEINGDQVLAPGPGHSLKDRSMSVKLSSTAPDGFLVNSFCGDDPIECKDHCRGLLGIPMPQRGGSKGPEWIYRTEKGEPYLQVRRVIKEGRKNYYQYHWDGVDWQKGKPSGPKIPYRLPQLIESKDRTVFFVEGEKCADAVATLGLVATCYSEGAAQRWPTGMEEWFRGRVVVVLPDNDAVGAKHAAKVRSALEGVAKRVTVLGLAGLEDGEDVYEWLHKYKHTREELERLSTEALRAPATTTGNGKHEDSPARMLLTNKEFMEAFDPPDYLIEGFLQRRYLYSLTGRTGHGKTAVALCLAAHVLTGKPLGKSEVERGKVVVFAGENSTDVKMRWSKVMRERGLPEDSEIFWLDGVYDLGNPAVKRQLEREFASIGPISLVIVDSSAAYFSGDDENSNTQLGQHARVLRFFTGLSGGPCALVLAHPAKHADEEQLIPRGGSAFLAEIDGNLACKITGLMVDLEIQGKWRGINLEPLHFRLDVGPSGLKDRKGKDLSQVTAHIITDEERDRLSDVAGDKEARLMALMLRSPGLSLKDMAVQLGWKNQQGEASKVNVQYFMRRLVAAGLARKGMGEKYELTRAGAKQARDLGGGAGPDGATAGDPEQGDLI